jgi:hypothetical protein
MFARGHARPERELADIISQYPGLEDGHVAQHTITALVNRGWLTTTESFGQRITLAASDLREKMEQQVSNSILVDRLSTLRSHYSVLEPHIRILGPMTTQYVFGSYLDLLRSAHREICLPMLATSPNLTAVSILQERARQGVHIRILLATPGVAAKLRGGPLAARAREAIEGWTKNARGIPQMEIRIAHHLEDMHFATSWTLDRRLLRFDIYDPSRQRSLEGVMIEVESPAGFDLNLVTLFQARFDVAWNRAQPIDVFGKVRWWVTSNWQWLAFGVTALVALSLGPSVWGGIAGSVAATFLFNALVSSWPAIRSLLRRILGD